MTASGAPQGSGTHDNEGTRGQVDPEASASSSARLGRCLGCGARCIGDWCVLCGAIRAEVHGLKGKHISGPEPPTCVDCGTPVEVKDERHPPKRCSRCTRLWDSARRAEWYTKNRRRCPSCGRVCTGRGRTCRKCEEEK